MYIYIYCNMIAYIYKYICNQSINPPWILGTRQPEAFCDFQVYLPSGNETWPMVKKETPTAAYDKHMFFFQETKFEE